MTRPKYPPSRAKPLRFGPMTAAETALVQKVVDDSPREWDEQQVDALSVALRRSPQAIEKAVANARAEIQERASRYGEIHLAAVEGALAEGDHETAAKESRAMLDSITDDEGKRVLGMKDAQAASGVQVMIGLKLGGRGGEGESQ